MLSRALCFGLILGLSWFSSARAASVVFLNPGLSDETFWVSYTRFMQAAADDLGMQLHVLYGERQAQRQLAQLRTVLQDAHKPDYLVLVNEQYAAPEMMRLARDSGIKLLLVNNGLTRSQADAVRAHPEAYAPLLGTLMTNDEQAGYQMLHDLVASLPASNEPVELLAFAGINTTPASQLRERGMRRALVQFPRVRLRQVVSGGWSRQRAFEQAQILVQRYPNIRLVWSANDEMAFGAMQAFEAAGRVPGKDVLFSAVNSSPQALQARVDGRLSVLMGGHFSLGGWAMVMLHDDASGLPLGRDGQRVRRLPVLQTIDAARAKRWLALGARPNYGIDFQHYSAQGKSADYRYPFLASPVEY
ncbi:ABC transporter substrate-binding protein [Pseudomonas sp. S75]|uniref:ABC transporter substrate-binding protein n=1 Tax=unclassified Pseudomonas TaxID=196821 RepID=UPI0019048584|nr:MULTISPECIES: ABC transporter substrate-binding protein [unclassified Pseudomonas]MBJ9973933.1 ABC transporter substrate-binding protein [Pseudomonas sp. S30]MBK0152137.1 ABC transporter substrate-binding protein [Pseudomonas sp. S75]